MAPRQAARSATVCTLILGWLIMTPRAAAAGSTATGAPTAAPTAASPAASPAARRPVAVIALADDPQVEAFANRIGTALVNHRALAPLEAGAMIGALVGEFLDESRDQIDTARSNRERADQALAEFEFPVAISTAQAGHESLHAVVPTTEAVELYSDLAMIVGKAKLGQNRPDEAAWFFGLVHQLTPGRRLDPALHLPEVVSAYEAAGTGLARPGTLIVQGSGRIWIDGQPQGGRGEAGGAAGDHGAGAARFRVPAGLHVVWLDGPDRETIGKQVYVAADRETTLELGEAPAPLRLRVQRTRRALRDAVADPAARAVAMHRLAELLGVHDAVLITKHAGERGKLTVQTWHDRAEGALLPGFSAHRLAEGEPPEDLLRPLAPPPARPRDSRPAPLPELPRPWYQRRPIQASIAVGVVGVIVGSVMLARRLEDRSVGLDGNTIFLPPRTAP